jgi:hypothetical protein
MNLRRQSTSAGAVRKKVSSTSASTSSSATQSTGTLVVVNKGNIKENSSLDQDPDILRLKVRFYYNFK